MWTAGGDPAHAHTPSQPRAVRLAPGTDLPLGCCPSWPLAGDRSAHRAQRPETQRLPPNLPFPPGLLEDSKVMRTPWGHWSGAPCGIVVDGSGCVYTCANRGAQPTCGQDRQGCPTGSPGLRWGLWHSQSLPGREACKPVARPALCRTDSALGGPSVRVLRWPLAPSPPWEGEPSHPKASLIGRRVR